MKRNFQQQTLPRLNAIGLAEFERRRYTRFISDIPAELIDEKLKNRISGIARNVGLGGCYIESAETLPAATRIFLDLKFKPHTFRCQAIVTHSLTCTGIGMGVAFTQHCLLEWLVHMDAIVSGEWQTYRVEDRIVPTRKNTG